MTAVRDNAQEYYRSLKRNILLTIILVSFTPMLVMSGIILQQFSTSYHDKVYAHLGTLVKKHKQNIDSFLRDKLADIRSLTRTFSVEELCNEGFLMDRLQILQEEQGSVYVDLGVVNPRGIQMAYAGPFKLGQALYSSAGWFQETLKKDHTISDVFLGLRGLPHFIVAVKENWQGDSWIIRSTIDFVAFNRLVESIRIGETGFAFILNREGSLQTKPLHEIAPQRAPYHGLLENGRTGGEEVKIVEGKDESGSDSLFVATFLKDGDWLLVYQQKVSDAFAELYRTVRLAILIVLLGGVGIVTMAFILSGRMVAKIAQADREKEKMDDQIVETGKLASIGELAAGIAHEINNPVAIMVEEAGWIGDLLEEEEFREGKNLEEFHRALKQIRTQGARCKEITHKLLSFARKTDSRAMDVKVNGLLEEVAYLSSQRARYSNVTLNTDLHEDIPSLRLSPSEMQQVFLNLINNALDAMEKKGGTLTLRTRLEEGTEERPGRVVVEFEDTGPGIPKANLQRIFDPFFTTKPVGKGTGLGLSICYGIVKKLGGEIEVQSGAGQGATFRILLPVGSAPEEKKPADSLPERNPKGT